MQSVGCVGVSVCGFGIIIEAIRTLKSHLIVHHSSVTNLSTNKITSCGSNNNYSQLHRQFNCAVNFQKFNSPQTCYALPFCGFKNTP